MVLKTWALAQKIDKNDFIWCQGLGVELSIENLFDTVHFANGAERKVASGQSIRIKTTCEKQETMLKLKYADNLYLVSEQITDPYNLKQLNF